MSSRWPIFSAAATARTSLRRRSRRTSSPRCSAASRRMTRKRPATMPWQVAARSRKSQWLQPTRPRTLRARPSPLQRKRSSACRCRARNRQALRAIRLRLLTRRPLRLPSRNLRSSPFRPTNTPRSRRSISSTRAASGIASRRRSPLPRRRSPLSKPAARSPLPIRSPQQACRRTSRRRSPMRLHPRRSIVPRSSPPAHRSRAVRASRHSLPIRCPARTSTRPMRRSLRPSVAPRPCFVPRRPIGLTISGCVQ